MIHERPIAAYLHVPFCAHHCGYCDFAVTAGRDHLIQLYLEAIGIELSQLGEPAPVRTIFWGGGTPTHLDARQLHHLVDLQSQWLPLLAGGEFSVESTPESITAEKLSVLTAGGLTRISIGVQTFDDRLLAALDRLHRTEHLLPAIACARGFGLQVSVDLIFGIPGQTPGDWRMDLQRAIDLGIDHISTYGLTYEKGTPLWKVREAGRIQPVEEEAELEMYLNALDMLAAAGYEHYEISNFARPGKRCRHNEVYWANGAHFGFGVGAAGYVGGVRKLNCRNTEDYIRRLLAGESPVFQSEQLGDRERAFETLAIQIRRAAGIDRGEFARQTGFDLHALAGNRLQMLLEAGLLEEQSGSVALTRRGKCLADSVVTELMRESAG